MITSAQAWEAVRAIAPRDQWLSIAQVYDIVASRLALDEDDQAPISPTNSSPRWKRTVRNALQRRKATGEVEWDGAGRYRVA